MLGILSGLHVLTHWSLTKSYKIEIITIPILPMKKLRHKEIKELVEEHIADNWWSRDYLSDSKAFVLHHPALL